MDRKKPKEKPKIMSDKEFAKMEEVWQVEMEHFKKTGIPRCQTCHKDFELAYDSIAKQVTGYLWKPTCKCISDDLRLSIG